MGRDVPIDPYEKCDMCGKVGAAYDFMGDIICVECYANLPDHDGCVPGKCEKCYPTKS